MTLAFLVLVGAGTSPLAAVAVVAVAAAVVAAAVVVVAAAVVVVAAAVVGCVVVVEVAIDYSRHLNHSTSADLVSISY